MQPPPPRVSPLTMRIELAMLLMQTKGWICTSTLTDLDNFCFFFKSSLLLGMIIFSSQSCIELLLTRLIMHGEHSMGNNYRERERERERGWERNREREREREIEIERERERERAWSILQVFFLSTRHQVTILPKQLHPCKSTGAFTLKKYHSIVRKSFLPNSVHNVKYFRELQQILQFHIIW